MRLDWRKRDFCGGSAAVMLVLLLGAGFATGILFQVDGVSGAWYWRRPWHDLGLLRTMALLAPPLLALGIALRDDRVRSAGDARARLAWLMLACFALQMLGALAHPDGFARVHAIVVSPVATSYFTDAMRIGDLRDWLANFHQATLSLHSSTHPPGPILFYRAAAAVAGAQAAPLLGAVVIAGFATLSIPVLWSFMRLWTERSLPRLLACALYALLPALIVFFPEFDQVYPIATMLIAYCWVRAVRGSIRHGALLGLVLFVATWFAWNLLALGTFLVLYGSYALARARWQAAAWRSIAASVGLAAAVCAGAYFLVWLATGYDPVASLRHAIEIQAGNAAVLDRPWLACVVFDPYDFLLGAGMLAAPLAAVFLCRAESAQGLGAQARALTWIGLATILSIDLSGLLRAETARVWLFLQPFLLVPAALGLATFPRRARIAVLALQWLILVALLCRIAFINP